MLRLLTAAMIVSVATAGCSERGCPDSLACVDLDTISRSAIDVSVLPGSAGQHRVYVSLALAPPARTNGCYQVAPDLEVRANGQMPEEPLQIHAYQGDSPSFFGSCSPFEQEGWATFQVPATTEPLRITFAEHGIEKSVDVIRPAIHPVDAVLPSQTLDPRSTFTVDLHEPGGTVPGAGCWTPTVEWGDHVFAYPEATAEPIADGVRLTLGFSADTMIPAGPAQLRLESRSDRGCEPVPTISCPWAWGCAVSMDTTHVLGPFAVDVR